MKKVHKLKSKIFLLILSGLFILLSVIIVVLYNFGLDFIRSSVENDIKALSNRAVIRFEDEIKNRAFEQIVFETQLAVEPPENTGNVIEKFLKLNYDRYAALKILLNGKDDYRIFIPGKIYSGEIEIKSKHLNPPIHEKRIDKSTSKSIYNLYILKTDTKDKTIEYISLNKSLSRYRISYFVKLDNISEQVFSGLNTGKEKTLLLVDSAGTVVYSSNITQNNQKLNLLYGNEFSSGKLTNLNRKNFEFDNKLALLRNVKSINLRILSISDYSGKISRLNSLLIKAIIFALLIIVFVLIIIYPALQKLSHSVERMEQVARKVANEDFSETIDIKTNDEVGVLIQTFNDMVQKLSASYEKLKVTNTELEAKIIELKKTRAELSSKQKLALIGETISKISHEIQNKIGGLSIWIQNLELKNKDDDVSLLYIREMRKALKSFLNMLINFKKFYRQPILDLTEFKIEDLINNVVNQFQTDLEEKNISIIKKLDNNCSLSADRALLEEAMINIIINAIFYSPTDGKIIIICSSGNGLIKILIADEGPGIDKKDTEKLFVPFFTTKSGGSGLGLAIAKNIITAHKGKIKIFNNPNQKGAIAAIILPRITKDETSLDSSGRVPSNQNIKL
ncbi:signal-transduction histidine kinase senX3 [bacterium BMS3Abin03]|nr:signal-transduction histidine kinase senX3 [bacterium BMS3Abin03]